jgi:cbb3-type cytochrome oxidase maturation protein
VNVIWFLLPVSILLGLSFLIAFIWSVRKGQLDDMETPAYRMLLDDEKVNK